MSCRVIALLDKHGLNEKQLGIMKTINILIADDHVMIRDGIKHLLADIGDVFFEEASDGVEAIEIYQKCQPDLLIIDLSMPGMGGLEALEQIFTIDKDAKVIVHSMYDSEAHVTRCIETGVQGYVAKGESRGELSIAVKSVLQGGTYFSMTVKNSIIRSFKSTAAREPISAITPREKEIVKLISDGLTSSQIAQRLSISPRTVDTHRANLMKKLNARNTIELLRKLNANETETRQTW